MEILSYGVEEAARLVRHMPLTVGWLKARYLGIATTSLFCDPERLRVSHPSDSLLFRRISKEVFLQSS